MKNFLQNKNRKNNSNNNIKNIFTKTLWISAIAMGILTGCSPKNESQQPEVARIDDIFYNPENSKNVAIMSMKTENFHHFCNFTHIEKNGKKYQLTAAHCVQKDDSIDVIITESIEESLEKNINSDAEITIENWFQNPIVHKISILSEEEISHHKAKIEGCYPDLQKVTCFQISGGITLFNADKNEYLMYLSNEDYEKLRQQNTDPNRLGLEGISGSIVFDKDNNVIRVVSRAAKSDNFLFFDLPGIPIIISGVSKK